MKSSNLSLRQFNCNYEAICATFSTKGELKQWKFLRNHNLTTSSVLRRTPHSDRHSVTVSSVRTGLIFKGRWVKKCSHGPQYPGSLLQLAYWPVSRYRERLRIENTFPSPLQTDSYMAPPLPATSSCLSKGTDELFFCEGKRSRPIQLNRYRRLFREELVPASLSLCSHCKLASTGVMCSYLLVHYGSPGEKK